jgi:hypothetical protein
VSPFRFERDPCRHGTLRRDGGPETGDSFRLLTVKHVRDGHFRTNRFSRRGCAICEYVRAEMVELELERLERFRGREPITRQYMNQQNKAEFN